MKVLLCAVALLLCASCTTYQPRTWSANAEEPLSLPPGTVLPLAGTMYLVEGYVTNKVVATLKEVGATHVWLRNSPGGEVSAARDLYASFERIVVSGSRCASACAMILVEANNACVTGSVKTITFHSIVVRYPGVAVLAQPSTDAFVRHIREPLRSRLQGMTRAEQWIDIPAREFLAVYPERACQGG